MERTRNNRSWAIIILILAIALQTQAQNLISLKLENKPLPAALKLIEREGGKNVIFSVTETEKHSVSSDIREKTQAEAIGMVLQGTPFIYKERTDYFVSVTDTLGVNKTVVMPLNLGTQKYYGMSLSQTLQPFQTMSIHFSGRVYYLDNQLAFNKTRLYHRNRWAYGLMMQTSFPLFLGIHSEILGIYSSKRLGGATDVLGANYQVNIGFQKKFLNERAIVKLSMSDIFWTSNWDSVNKFDGFESINYGYGESRLIRLNFTFKFGGNKNNYSKESKIESEMNRF